MRKPDIKTDVEMDYKLVVITELRELLLTRT